MGETKSLSSGGSVKNGHFPTLSSWNIFNNEELAGEKDLSGKQRAVSFPGNKNITSYKCIAAPCYLLISYKKHLFLSD